MCAGMCVLLPQSLELFFSAWMSSAINTVRGPYMIHLLNHTPIRSHYYFSPHYELYLNHLTTKLSLPIELDTVAAIQNLSLLLQWIPMATGHCAP